MPLTPRVEPIVITRPRLLSSAGRAARTTAAVPIRLTAITRFQSSPLIRSSGPHESVPAAATTASRPPWRSITRAVAASAAALSARSTSSDSIPSAAWMSSPTGSPPAPFTASAIARPRPPAAPVTITVPISVSDTAVCLLDQLRGRSPLEERQDRDPASPSGDRFALRQLVHLVVAALGPDVRAQQGQRRRGIGLLEDHHL